jgi:hypothetical protein
VAPVGGGGHEWRARLHREVVVGIPRILLPTCCAREPRASLVRVSAAD